MTHRNVVLSFNLGIAMLVGNKKEANFKLNGYDLTFLLISP